MSDPVFRRAVRLILVLAALLRLGYLCFGDVLPVMWDARRYAAAGLALISYVDTSAPPRPADAAADRGQFEYYHDRYIQGERIDWLSYPPHRLTQAREDLYFAGPLYPAVLAVLFAVSPVADFTIVRLFGAAMDVTAILLVVLIGVRLVGRRAALVAAGLYSVYFPFVLASSMVLLETSTALLLLLAVYLLIRAVESGDRRCFIWAGLVVGALVLNKPTATLLGVPLFLAYLIYAGKGQSAADHLRHSLWFVVPAGVIFSIWLAVASIHYGQLTLRDPVYVDGNLRQSSSIADEGYDRDFVDDGFWQRSVADDIAQDPVGYAGLLIKKLDRLWRRPFNDFGKNFIVPARAIETFHLGVVIFGLIGLVLIMRRDLRAAAWPVLIIGYYTAVHLIYHSLSRYHLQALPFLMLGTGVCLMAGFEAVSGSRPGLRRQLLHGLILLTAAWLFDPAWINALFRTGMTEALVAGGLIVRVSLLGSALSVLFKALGGLSWRAALGWATPVVAVLAMVMSVNAFDRDRWAEFSCRIESDTVRAGARIFVSRVPVVEPGDQLFAAVDLNSEGSRGNAFVLNVNDASLHLVAGQSPLTNFFYPKAAYRHYAGLIGMGVEEFRQYALVPVPDSILVPMLAQQGYVDVSVSLSGCPGGRCAPMNVWGRFDGGGDHAVMPSWLATSVERFVHEGDPRIPVPVNYLSDSVISYYIARDAVSAQGTTDLSPAPGLQSGRYNIFLIHRRADGRLSVY